MKICVNPQCAAISGAAAARELEDDADVCDACNADQQPVVAQPQPVVQPVVQAQPVVAQPQPVVQPVVQAQPVVADPNAGQPAPVVPWYKRYSVSTMAWIAVGIILVLVVLGFGIKGIVGAGEQVVGGPGPNPDPSHDPAPPRTPDPNPAPPRRDPDRPFDPTQVGRPETPTVAGQCAPGLTRREYDPTSGSADPASDTNCAYAGLITEPAEKEGWLYYCCR